MASYDENLDENNIVSCIEFLVKNNTNIILVNEIDYYLKNIAKGVIYVNITSKILELFLQRYS